MAALAVLTRPTDGDTDDRDLVAGVRAGDDRAFELLFERYQPRITAYVRGMVHDHGRAEDITQEVFIAALRRLRAESEREILFKPWIFEIAKNRCIDAFRRTRNAREVSFDARDAIGADEHGRLAEPGATPDSAVEGKLAIDNLCGAFGGLTAVHHEILVLRELEGLSYREIGDRLGMSRAAVESTLFRARKRLSEEYEELVSGERCLRVQQIVDTSGGRSVRLREQRRMARHLAHCQSCRRYAGRAGVDLGRVSRPAAAAARIAAFLPLPAFLRRRSGGADDASALLGHGGQVSQWSANVATILDPGLVSSWTKAIATAASVAVAGMGAGAALSERSTALMPGASSPNGPAGLVAGGGDRSVGAPSHARASERATRSVQPPAAARQAAAGAGHSHPAAAAAAPLPASSAQPQSQADKAARRPSERASGHVPAGGGSARGSAPAAPDPDQTVGGAVGTVGAVGGGAVSAGNGSAAGSGAPELVEGARAPAPAVPARPSDAAAATAGTVTGQAPAATATAGSVTSTVPGSLAPTTTAPPNLGG